MITARGTPKGTGRVLATGSVVAALCALCAPAAAQTSAGFRLTESVMNAGGNPRDGSRPASASYRISHDALGAALTGGALTSPAFRAEGGFVGRYRPAGEVPDVRFADRTTLTWNHDPSAGAYNLYRDALASLPGNYGGCYRSALAGPPFVEAAAPAGGTGWFYLVTVENRLGEEGTKGRRSDGTERTNPAPCP